MDDFSFLELSKILIDIGRYLISKVRILIFIGLIGGILGLAYKYSRKLIYTAQLTFAVEENNSNNTNALAGLANQFGLDLGGNSNGIFSEDNIMVLLKSKNIIYKAWLSPIKVKDTIIPLVSYYLYFSGICNKWVRPSQSSNELNFSVGQNINSLTIPQDSLLNILTKNVILKSLIVKRQNLNSNIISINFESRSEKFAKIYSEALVNCVSNLYISLKTRKINNDIEVLQSKLDSVKNLYNQTLFNSAHNIDVNQNSILAVSNVPRLKNQIHLQILIDEYETITKNIELNRISLLQNTPLIQIIDKPFLPLTNNKLGFVFSLLMGFFLFFSLGTIFFIIKYFNIDSVL